MRPFQIPIDAVLVFAVGVNLLGFGVVAIEYMREILNRDRPQGTLLPPFHARSVWREHRCVHPESHLRQAAAALLVGGAIVMAVGVWRWVA